MKEIYLTSIKKIKKLYELIFKVDEESYAIKVSEDLVIEERFFQPKKIDYLDYQAFLNKLPLDSLSYAAIKYVEKKMRSEKEVREHLLSHSNDLNLIDQAIKILKTKHLIDDESFIKSYLDYAIDVKKDGRLKIESGLQLYGIKYIVDYPINKMKENIVYLLNKFNIQTKNTTYKEKIIKAKKYLLSKGYTESDIDKCFDSSLITSEDEAKLFQKELAKLKRKEKDNEVIKTKLLKKGFSRKLIDSI